jgi:hypothetical protein
MLSHGQVLRQLDFGPMHGCHALAPAYRTKVQFAGPVRVGTISKDASSYGTGTAKNWLRALLAGFEPKRRMKTRTICIRGCCGARIARTKS